MVISVCHIQCYHLTNLISNLIIMYNFKQLLLLFVFLLISSISVLAQSNNDNIIVKFKPVSVIDSSRIECIYDYWSKDTILNRWDYAEMLLQLGKKYTKYMAYQTFRYDSVYANKDKTKITWGESKKIRKENGLENTSFSDLRVLKEYNSDKMTYTDRVMIDKYVYPDSIPDLKWELVDTTRVFCGYVCHKATTHFRGRDWIAWYSDIPINAGPWKFSGLPGLILAVYDKTTVQRFIVNTIRNLQSPILHKEINYFKTTRERFNKALKNYKEGPLEMLQNTPLMPTVVENGGGDYGTPNKRLIFNSIELE